MLNALILLALAAPQSAPGLMWTREPHAERVPTSVLEILAHAATLTVYALDPMTPDSPSRTVEPGKPPPELFDMYPIIGAVRVADPKQVREIAAILRKGMLGPGASACFYPRHAVRAQAPGGRVDFMICFECGETVVVGKDSSGRVKTDESARDMLNALLKANGVTPLEPSAAGSR